MNGKPRSLSRSRATRIGLLVAALTISFLLGFVPQWRRAQSLEDRIEEMASDLAILDVEARLGAALAESQRANYERARQLMVGVFSELQSRRGQVANPARRAEIDALLGQRDEIITLLSRAAPESVSRLNLMYTAFFAAFHSEGAASPPAATPSSPP
ncbi:MAG: hypothetical protein GEU90_02005 [Gemmatimonas sp.]|nr:hypothetical protein [Gemmatimonas sp.]